MRADVERRLPAETVGDLLLAGGRSLGEAGVPEAPAVAGVLLARLLGVARYELYLAPGRRVAPAAARRFRRWLARRGRGEPLQYLTGEVYFAGQSFTIGRGVFIPRPETEFLVVAALERLDAGDRRLLLLDVGTGSGVIGLTLARRTAARVVMIDRSVRAVRRARINRRRLGVSASRARVLRADLGAFVRRARSRFDLVVSNPPYIARVEKERLPADVRREPAAALFAGPDGLAFIRRLTAAAPRLLVPGGRLIFEIGAGQAAPAVEAAAANGLAPESLLPDCAGITRVVVCRRH